ncbi:hypothetical protein M2459_001824 [Parabacteroides sp. PF5-5]|nr:hypothetical protein [Parabacteroides sp. PH5-39]MDH6316081.1 hypothetical protein [Parabacteroides sp. PF5-13]MDH6320231.1 hypothetical protein [Parabacteroides sp. PH5-13]MDH6323961.1 hypothetical protein [Parabacteroides sp. PH5-8]MDH6327272.1 hypothetical protein [Parabacteroides sp. PH5-41]MDH6335074.1 hypothetical protein [Parabacteroides sp. PF5-5]MDH6346305.1 hypothetical protein [Parabacteroides sp. PH5-46]MDH6361094.1 hypothetical protein [Parabacteroides sp. PH5-16]MDH6376934.
MLPLYYFSRYVNLSKNSDSCANFFGEQDAKIQT